MPTPQHTSQRKFWRSRIPQTDYNTATSVAGGGAANFKQVIAKDKNLASAAPTLADNKDYATGRPNATEQWIVAHDAQRAFEYDLCFEEIGRALLLALGKVVTTQPDAIGSPTVYQHVFSPMDVSVSRQLPATTLVETLGSAIDRKFPSMVSAQLGFKGEGSGRLAVSEQLQGSGKLITPSGLTGADIAGCNYAYQHECTLKTDDGATVTNMATAPQRVNSHSFDIINQILNDDGYRPGAAAFQTAVNPDSGEVRTEALLGDQSFNFGFNVRLLSNDGFLAYLLAQTSLILTNDIVGTPIDGTYNRKLSVKAYKAPFKAVPLGERNGLVTLDIASNVMWDTTSGKNVEITLINTVSSYTT
jgi:hypothetical protein